MASFLSVASFDFFFVPPRLSFTVNDPQYLVTFAVMLAVALIIGHLTSGLQRQARIAVKNERRAHALYEMARALTGALTITQVSAITCRFLQDAVDVQATLLLPDETGQLKPTTDLGDSLQVVSPMMTSLAYRNTTCTDLNAPHPIRYFPLQTPTRVGRLPYQAVRNRRIAGEDTRRAAPCGCERS